MRINYILTVEDYVNFQMNHIFLDKKARFSFFLSRFAIPVALFLFPFIFNIGIPWPIFALIAVAYFLIYPKFFLNRMRRRMNRVLSHPANQSLTSERKMEADDDSLRITIAPFKETTVLEWDHIAKFSEVRDYFYIYTSPKIAFIVPKRCFENIEAETLFRETVSGNVG